MAFNLEMPQTRPVDNQLALSVKPWTFDAGNALQQAGDIRGKELANQGQVTSNQLNSLQLREATGRANALEGFRTTGDPAALKGYPDIQVDLYEALDKLKGRELEQAVQKGKTLAQRALRVAQIPEGAPERVEAWNQVLDESVEDGLIDEDQAAQYYGKPSDLIIDQVLKMGQTVDQFMADKEAKNSKAYERGRQETLDALSARETEAKIKKLEAEAEQPGGGEGTQTERIWERLRKEYPHFTPLEALKLAQGGSTDDTLKREALAVDLVKGTNEFQYGNAEERKALLDEARKLYGLTGKPPVAANEITPSAAKNPGAPTRVPPPEAVKRLQDNAGNPKALADFDATFGAGAAAAALGQ